MGCGTRYLNCLLLIGAIATFSYGDHKTTADEAGDELRGIGLLALGTLFDALTVTFEEKVFFSARPERARNCA